MSDTGMPRLDSKCFGSFLWLMRKALIASLFRCPTRRLRFGIAQFILFLERFSIECRKTKTKVICKSNNSGQSQQMQEAQGANQNSKQRHVTGRKHDWFWFGFPLVEITNHRA